MDEPDEYDLIAINTWLFSGSYSPNEVKAMIDDIPLGSSMKVRSTAFTALQSVTSWV
jgi:hypothetical protein